MTGGTTPFTFLWSNGQLGTVATGLSVGTVSVTLTDGVGCVNITTTPVTEPTLLNASIVGSTDVLCAGESTGTISLTVLGGSTGYSYLWDDAGASTTQDLSGLPGGSYTVVVTDANTCTATDNVIINVPAAITLTTLPTDALCAAASDGSINLTVAGGTTGYTFNWSNGTSSEDLAGIGAGSYTVTVTDAGLCVSTITAVVNQPTPLVVTTAFCTDETAPNASDGATSASATGGTTNYTYVWSTGATTIGLSGLVSGTYTVTATDANGCFDITSCIVNNIPCSVTAATTLTDVTCNAASDGTATATMTGSLSTTFTYNWDNGQAGQTATGLDIGTYNVTVTDGNNCSFATSASIIEPSAIAITITPTNILCNGDANGAVDLTVSGGTPVYTFNWSTGPTAEDIIAPTGGTYSVTVTDAAGCSITATATVTEPTALTVTNTPLNASCNGVSDGSIALTIAGGSTAYSFAWSNGETTAAVTGLPAGNYSATTTDANGCIDIQTVVITEPQLITLTTSFTPANCGQADGSVTVVAAGTDAPFTYYGMMGVLLLPQQLPG